VAGLKGVVLAGVGSADAPGTRTINVQMVQYFCKSWADDPPDPENMAAKYPAGDCIIRFGDTIAPIIGRVAAAALLETFLGNHRRYDFKILEDFVRGPIIVTSRINSRVSGTTKRMRLPSSVFSM